MSALFIKLRILLILQILLFQFLHSREYTIGNIKIEAEKEITYDVEKGIISAKSGIVIKNESLKVYGKKMIFYVEEKIAEIEGEPIKIDGNEFYMKLDRVKIFFLKKNLISTGNINFFYGDNTLKCSKIFYDLKNERGIAENDVVFIHSFPTEKKIKIEGKESELIELKTNKITLLSDKVEIDKKRNWALATGKPKVEIDEGYFTSQQLEFDFSKKEITGKGSIYILIKDIIISGEKLKLNYEKEIAVVEKANCKYKENTMKGDLIELYYSEEKHLISIKGGSEFNIIVENDNK